MLNKALHNDNVRWSVGTAPCILIVITLYTPCPKKIVPFFIFFLGTQCVESGVSCTDCYQILLVLIEIHAVPVDTKCSRWRPPNNRRHFVLWNTQRQRLLSQFNANFEDSLRSIRRTRTPLKTCRIIPVFFSSKCRLFHNATFFGSCIIHILNTTQINFGI